MPIKSEISSIGARRFLASLRDVFSTPKRVSLPKTPEAILARLDTAFNLKLDIVPNQRAFLLDRITQTSIEIPGFIEKLHKVVEIDPIKISRLNSILKYADLEIIRIGDQYRITEREQKENKARLVAASLMHETVTPEGIRLNAGSEEPIIRGIYFSKSEDVRTQSDINQLCEVAVDPFILYKESAKRYYMGITNNIPEEYIIKVGDDGDGGISLFSVGKKSIRIFLSRQRGKNVVFKALEEKGKRWLLVYHGDKLVYKKYWDINKLKFVEPISLFRRSAKQFYVENKDNIPDEVEAIVPKCISFMLFKVNKRGRGITLRSKYRGEMVLLKASIDENNTRWLLVYHNGELIYKGYWNKNKKNFYSVPVSEINISRKQLKEYFTGKNNTPPEEQDWLVPNNGKVTIFTIKGRSSCMLDMLMYKGKTLKIKPYEENGKRWLGIYHMDKLVDKRYWDKEKEEFIDPVALFRERAKGYFAEDGNLIPEEIEMVIPEYGQLCVFSLGKKAIIVSMKNYVGKSVKMQCLMKEGKKWLLICLNGELIYNKYWDSSVQQFVDQFSHFRRISCDYYAIGRKMPPPEIEIIISEKGMFYMFSFLKRVKNIQFSYEHLKKVVRLIPLEENGKRWILAYDQEKLIYKGYWDQKKAKFISTIINGESSEDKYLNEVDIEHLYLLEILRQSQDQDKKAGHNGEIEQIELEIK